MIPTHNVYTLLVTVVLYERGFYTGLPFWGEGRDCTVALNFSNRFVAVQFIRKESCERNGRPIDGKTIGKK